MNRTLAALSIVAILIGTCKEANAVLQFRNFVEVSPFADGDNWFLTQELRYEIQDTGVIVPVPKGFVTDFASIPRPFWSVLPRWGKYGAPAVVHDYLYWDQQCSRDQADKILLIAMEEMDVGPVWRFIIHRAVSWGGAIAWKNNARMRAKGRTREIPSGWLPSDPKITWAMLQDQLFENGTRPDPRPAPGHRPVHCTEIDEISREQSIKTP